MNFKATLKKEAQAFSIDLNETQLSQLELYYTLLIEKNKVMNLTAITDPYEVIVKHFVDSLCLFKFTDIKNGASLIDVGTGAGFPGIPIKIYRPDIKLTLLDSLNKRLVFLRETCEKLGIEADFIHSRAEDGAKKPELREKFDCATSRAVARMSVLSEYCLPYVRLGGKFLALKGPGAQAELADAANAIETLGAGNCSFYSFELCGGEQRVILELEKLKHTPKAYPRQSGKIKAAPL